MDVLSSVRSLYAGLPSTLRGVLSAQNSSLRKGPMGCLPLAERSQPWRIWVPASLEASGRDSGCELSSCGALPGTNLSSGVSDAAGTALGWD